MFHKTYFRNGFERLLNFVTFPYRAFILNPNQSGTILMCLRDERMYYVAAQTQGKTLDLGCGPDNVFIEQFVHRNGIGVDVFPYPGLASEQILTDPPMLPFEDASFDTITLIANVNHIPSSIIAREFQEIARVLRPGGKLLITRIGLITSLLTHTVVKLQSLVSSKYYDMDTERGVEDDERYTVSRSEIQHLAKTTGHELLHIQKFWTQWWLNELMIFSKKL